MERRTRRCLTFYVNGPSKKDLQSEMSVELGDFLDWSALKIVTIISSPQMPLSGLLLHNTSLIQLFAHPIKPRWNNKKTAVYDATMLF